jgi:hypothetical protein
VIWVMAVGGLIAATAAGEDLSPAALLKEARHQEEMLGRLEAATQLYALVLERDDVTAEQQAEAHTRLGQCLEKQGRLEEARDHYQWVTDNAPAGAERERASAERGLDRLATLAGHNPAALMPPDTAIYLEVIRPGEQLAQLLEMFAEGGVPNPIETLLQQHNRPGPTSRGAGGARTQAFAAPMAMMLNPSLVNELKKIEGLALGFTEISSDPAHHGPPSFLAVLYPGESDAVRGMLELLIGTSSIMTTTVDGVTVHRMRIHDYPSNHVAITPKAIIFATSQSLMADTVRRLNATSADGGMGSAVESLASEEDFRRQAGARRRDSAVLAYVSLDRLFDQIERSMSDQERQEFSQISRLLGLESIQQFSARMRFTKSGLAYEVAGSLKPGADSLLYETLRTPPLDRELLGYIPAHALLAFATAMGNGAHRYDQALQVANYIHDISCPDGRGSDPEEEATELDQMLGVSVRNDLFGNVESVVACFRKPDREQIVRTMKAMVDAGGVPDRGDPHEVLAHHAFGEIAQSSLLAVIRVKDGDAFDRTLGTLLTNLARKFTRQQNVESIFTSRVDGDAEIRKYVSPGLPVTLSVARIGNTYVLGLSEDTILAALAVRRGASPSIVTGEVDGPVFAELPDAVSKVGTVRLDLVVNLFRDLAISANHVLDGAPLEGQPDPRSGGMVLVEVPPLRPMVAYTLESDSNASLQVEIHNLPQVLAASMQQWTGVLDPLRDRQYVARQIRDMHSVAQALLMYSVDHRGRMPDALQDLKKYLKEENTGDGSSGVSFEGLVYRRSVDKIDAIRNPSGAIIVHTPSEPWPDEGVIAAFADGHVELIRDKARFHQLLATTDTAREATTGR